MARHQSSVRIGLAVLGAAAIVAALFTWGPWARHESPKAAQPPTCANSDTATQPNKNVDGRGEPVLKSLLVNVAGTDEAMGPCHVLAQAPSGNTSEARKISSSRFAFDNALPVNTTLFALVVGVASGAQPRSRP